MSQEGKRPNIRVRIRGMSPIEQMKMALEEKLKGIKRKIVIMSGKGGVGKSFIAANLALALAEKGYMVGVLDLDFHGPSTPRMLGMKVRGLVALSDGIMPATGPLGIQVMSLDFLLPDDTTPVIWRGPLKAKAVTQFITDVYWPELDYLIVDMPPGTGDEALTVAQQLPPMDGAVFVTIPSEISVEVVGRSVAFAEKVGIKPLGVVENMSSFYCPCCHTTYRIFGKSSGKVIAEKFGIRFLGEIPLDPRVGEALEKMAPFLLAYPDSPASEAIRKFADAVEDVLGGPLASEGKGGGGQE